MTLLYSFIAIVIYIGIVLFVCKFVGFNDYED